jgi:hypothetical protein
VRLPDEDVDRLADYLEEQVAGYGEVNRIRVPHLTDPARKLGIFEVADCPSPGTTTWCTFGMAHRDWADSDFPGRVELVTAIRGTEFRLHLMLADLAHTMMDRGFLPREGATIANALTWDDNLRPLAERMPHLVVVHPYVWGGRLVSTDTATATVWLHQVQPIYDAERRLIQDEGVAAFVERLVAEKIVLVDPNRRSSVDY